VESREKCQAPKEQQYLEGPLRMLVQPGWEGVLAHGGAGGEKGGREQEKKGAFRAESKSPEQFSRGALHKKGREDAKLGRGARCREKGE